MVHFQGPEGSCGAQFTLILIFTVYSHYLYLNSVIHTRVQVKLFLRTYNIECKSVKSNLGVSSV